MIQLSSPATDSGSLAFPDMTALLDVIFILLVFLLLTANSAQQVLDITLPQEGAEQAQPLTEVEPLTITLFAAADQWAIGSNEFNSWATFEQALQQQVAQQPEPNIVIAGDRQAPLEKVLKLFSWLQRHQLEATQILIEPDA